MAIDNTDLRPANHDIERWLTERNVTFTYHPDLPIDQVDIVAGIANQARLEPVDPDVVDRYAADMDRGDTFPPVLLVRCGRNRLVPLGGNHRLAAARRLDKPTIAAYVIDAEPEMATRLMYEDNRRHGLPPGDEERILQATHLVNTGYTIAAAAEVVGLPRHKIDAAIGTAEADKRAAALGIKGWATLNKGSRARLGAIRSDPVLAEAAQLAIGTFMGNEDVRQLVAELGRTRSDAEALTHLTKIGDAQKAKAQRTAGGKASKQTARSRLLGYLSSVGTTRPADVVAACPDTEARRQLSRRCDETITHLDQIRKALR